MTDFIFPHTYPPKNAPDFTTPNRDTPKSHPILGLTLRRRIVLGRMQYAPTRIHEKPGGFHISAHGYTQIPPCFIPKPSAQDHFRGVCFCAPTRIRAKPARFYTQTVGDGTFRGVCFCALHGYVQNLAGFIFPHTDAPKTHPISPSPIRIYPKPARFYTQTIGEGHSGAYAIRPYTGTCKI